MDLMEIFTKGGPVMYLLLATSIIVAAIGIERLRFYSYVESGSENFLFNLKGRLRAHKAEDVLSYCRQKKSCLREIAVAGISAALNGENVEVAMNLVYEEVAMNLRARLNYLSMIVTLAPLLGLLGTIFGMIETFNIFSVQAGQPLAITGGIGEALIATATGLCVAIFALIVHTYFTQRLDEILSKLDKTILLVLGKFGGESELNETPRLSRNETADSYDYSDD